MKVYIVWDNDDFGGMFSPSPNEIDSIFQDESKANAKRDDLNKRREKWRTKARVEGVEVE